MGIDKTIQGRFDFGVEESENIEEMEELSEHVEFQRGFHSSGHCRCYAD